MKQFEIDLAELAKSASNAKKNDLVNNLFEVVFHAATAAGINTFVLNAVYKEAQNNINAKKSSLSLEHECYNLLRINKSDEPISKIPNIATRRSNIYNKIDAPGRIFTIKNAAQQIADISSSTFRLSTTDTYWMCFLLHNNLNAISHYEYSLHKFLNKQENYPAQIIGILKDLTGIERSFRDILPDEALKPKNLNFIEQLEESISCDYLLNYMRPEQTFRIQYYTDILFLLNNKNPEKIYSNVTGLNHKDTYKCFISPLEEISDTQLLTFFSYLDTMPNYTLIMKKRKQVYYFLLSKHSLKTDCSNS